MVISWPTQQSQRAWNTPAEYPSWEFKHDTREFHTNDFIMVFLTHWGRVKHICISNLTIIGSDNGLSPGRRQAIIWTNVRILLIGPLGTNFSEMLIEIHIFSFKKIDLKMSSGKWRPFCLGLNVLKKIQGQKHLYEIVIADVLVQYIHSVLIIRPL